jgi:putative glutathione S-transferase
LGHRRRQRGPESGAGGFKAESGRYHLYVSYACPWAHRTLVMRAWKGLEAHVTASSVHPLMLENDWEFCTDFEAADGDPLYGLAKLYELYQKADTHYTGRVTVPVLWDKQRQTIVNNESSEIIRMLGSAFDGVGARPATTTPPTCARRSMPSTTWCTHAWTTACTAPVSRPARRPTTKP